MPGPELRFRLVVGVGALVAAVAAGAWWSLRSAEPVPIEIEAPQLAPAETTITVHVAGAVATPGLVRVDQQARVADAVAAAGGAVPGADLGTINLAALVQDGDRLDVPFRGEPAPTSDTATGVDLNRATAGELEALPGVGPVLAERIVSYRELHGPFVTVEDLLDVSGIGEAKLESMRAGIARP